MKVCSVGKIREEKKKWINQSQTEEYGLRDRNEKNKQNKASGYV